jgi:hypothetical protein
MDFLENMYREFSGALGIRSFGRIQPVISVQGRKKIPVHLFGEAEPVTRCDSGSELDVRQGHSY